MSNRKEHGERNKSLSEKLFSEKTYYDWVVTTAFYSAIHILEDKILPITINTINCSCIANVKKAYKLRGRHESREKLVTLNCDQKIAINYKWLDDRSRYSRYTSHKTTSAEASKAIQFLNEIHKNCYSKT